MPDNALNRMSGQVDEPLPQIGSVHAHLNMSNALTAKQKAGELIQIADRQQPSIRPLLTLVDGRNNNMRQSNTMHSSQSFYNKQIIARTIDSSSLGHHHKKENSRNYLSRRVNQLDSKEEFVYEGKNQSPLDAANEEHSATTQLVGYANVPLVADMRRFNDALETKRKRKSFAAVRQSSSVRRGGASKSKLKLP